RNISQVYDDAKWAIPEYGPLRCALIAARAPTSAAKIPNATIDALAGILRSRRARRAAAAAMITERTSGWNGTLEVNPSNPHHNPRPARRTAVESQRIGFRSRVMSRQKKERREMYQSSHHAEWARISFQSAIAMPAIDR